MEDLNFIRMQVRRILSEEDRERGLAGSKSWSEVKGNVELSLKQPNTVMQNFGVADFKPEGNDGAHRVGTLLLKIKASSMNSDDFFLAVDRIEVEGDAVKVYPARGNVGNESKNIIPTSRLGHYIKAILVAANGTGKLSYDVKKTPVNHVTGKYVVIRMG